MRSVIQRVEQANVTVDGQVVGQIGAGLLVLLAVAEDDTISDLEYMVNKIVNLRIFPDEKDKINLSVLDVGQEVLVVSQFTLLGDCRKGMRPSFIQAARPEKAKDMYLKVIEKIQQSGVRVAQGIFQAQMKVQLINDGPITIIVDSRRIL
jgi:D-tyrosyl-tRNA(Tyr) deacylase